MTITVFPFWTKLYIFEQYNSVSVCSFLLIVNTPCVGGFGKLLVVDHDDDRLQTSFNSATNHVLLEQHLSTTYLTDFERNMSAWFDNPLEVFEDVRHGIFPILDRFQLTDFNGG